MSDRTVAFLRAINVGGHRARMETLREAAESLGLRNAATFLASGNLIFDGAPRPALAGRLSTALHRALGYEVAVFLRTGAEVAAIAQRRPFPEDQLAEAGAFSVGFLDAPLDQASERILAGFRTDLDDFRIEGREFYWMSKAKQSESAFTAGAFERAAKVQTTLRGMSTLRRLVEGLDR